MQLASSEPLNLSPACGELRCSVLGESKRRAPSALAPPFWQSTSPRRPQRGSPSASSLAAGQLTPSRSAMAASAAIRKPETTSHGQLLPSTRSELELAAGCRFSRTASQDPGSTRHGACALSARCRARRVADEMPVRQRRQVCVGRREPTRAWLLHAYSGHAGVLAASHQERPSHRASRRGCYQREGEAGAREFRRLVVLRAISAEDAGGRVRNPGEAVV